MGRKRKKQKESEGFKVETAKDPIDADSPEVVEAVERFNEEQSAEIDKLMDDAPDDDLPDPNRNKVEEPADETPSDETAETEQERQPEAKGPEVETEARAEEQLPTEEVKPEVEAVPESQEQPTEQQPAKTRYLSGEQYADYEVEIVTEDGSKGVPLQNLVITYSKYPEVQRKWAELKPVYELAQSAQVQIDQVLPLLELGIQTYAKQQGIISGTQPPVDGTFTPQPAGQPGQYNGPFRDEETDAYYKEADPDIWASMHRGHQSNIESAQRMANLEREIAQMKSSPAPSAGPTEEAIQKAFDGKIKAWAGDHTDYFTAENIGKVRMQSFQNFIIKNHAKSGLKISELTPEFLQAEFARFDPKYNLSYMEKLAAKKAAEAQSDSGMFAETSGVRSKAVPLSDQEQHMADMF